MLCHEDVKRSVCVALRDEGSELAASQGILFLLAWQLFAGQKACQSPQPRRAAIPGFLIDVPPGPAASSAALICGFDYSRGGSFQNVPIRQVFSPGRSIW